MDQHKVNAEIIRTDYCTSYIHDKHCHSQYEIIYVLEGSARVNVEGEWVLLTESSGIVIEPLKYHVVVGNYSGYHRLVIMFPNECIPKEIFAVFHKNICNNAVFFTDKITHILRKYAAVLEQQNPVYVPLLNAIFTEMLYSLTFDRVSPHESKSNKRTEKLKRVVDYIEDHLDQEISLEKLSDEMFISQSSLCHLFKAEMKISLKQYVLQKKMMYAQTLLQKGTTPGAAAIACGYRNYASFYKVFLKVTGKKPTDITLSNTATQSSE